MNNFAVLNIAYLHFTNAITICTTTNNPCHLTCYYTEKAPGRHRTARTDRGLTLPWGAYYCFVAWKSVEQNEPGDTLSHTFYITDWSYCQTKWFAFRGTVAEVLSPSVSCLFVHHHPGVIPGIEEQPLYDAVNFFLETRTKQGQRLTITNRIVSKLAWVLERHGPGGGGEISFAIRRVSDDGLIISKAWGLVASIPIDPTWLEVTFDTPVNINDQVRITAEWPNATFSTDSNIRFHLKISDVKPDEIYTVYDIDIWKEPWLWDAAYRYTFLQ